MGFAEPAFGLPRLSRVAKDDHPQDIFSNNTYTVRTCVPFGPVSRFFVATVAVSHGTERMVWRDEKLSLSWHAPRYCLLVSPIKGGQMAKTGSVIRATFVRLHPWRSENDASQARSARQSGLNALRVLSNFVRISSHSASTSLSTVMAPPAPTRHVCIPSLSSS
jgi:hypothetical protein